MADNSPVAAEITLPSSPPANPPVSNPVFLTITFKRNGENQLLFHAPNASDYVYKLEPAGSFLGYASFTWDKPKSTISWWYSGHSENFGGLNTTGNVPLRTELATTSAQPASTPATGVFPSLTNTPTDFVASDTPISSTLAQSSQAPAAENSATSAPVRLVKNGVTAGAAVGIAFGCLIAGAFIAGFVFWFCRRKRMAAPARGSDTSRVELISKEKGFAAGLTSPQNQNSALAEYYKNLPQPLEDKTISGDFSKISNSIKNHVQSFYSTNESISSLVNTDGLHELGVEMPISVGTLATLLGNPASRETAMRFCIAWAVISRIQPRKDQPHSLLPPEIVECIRQMEGKYQGSASISQLTAQWRVVTAELLRPTYARSPFVSSDSRNNSVRETLCALDKSLQPFANPRVDNEQRRGNLEEIIKRSAVFAFTLFSQPSSWNFDWKQDVRLDSDAFCVWPALVQVADDTGAPVHPPRVFSEAIVRPLDI